MALWRQFTVDRSRDIQFRLAFSIAAVLASGCGAEPVSRPSSETPVILISIDTLRADRLPMYGYDGIATPALDGLRADSILYSHAWSHCPLTLPSHATVFTGLLPSDTGVRDNVGYSLPESAVTLAERMKANGYETGGAVSSYVLRRATGIAQGFDFWDDEIDVREANMTVGRIQRPGAETIAAGMDWIRARRGPFIFFLHLYEPHTPYEPAEPFRSRYADPYNGEIAWTDELIGRFVADLRDAGIYDRALIVFFSDHGEGLGDHGEDEHGIFLYREAIHVPLLVKLPHGAAAGTTVTVPAQLSDVFPTVLEQTAAPARGTPVSARSLLRLREEDRGRLIYSETYYPRLHFGWSELHSLVGERHHYIDAPRRELYDLASDPEERRNVVEANRRVSFAMSRALSPTIRPLAAPSAVSGEDAAKLAALGYLGSSADLDGSVPLPDAKDEIGILTEVRAAFSLARDRRFAEALPLIETVLARNRRMVDLWALKSRVLAALGREPEAIEAAREGLRISPTARHLALQIAEISLGIGRIDDAEAHAELALETDPGQAHDVLSRVWLARGDLDRAEREARAALAGEEHRVGPLIALARIEKERNRLELALQYLDEASALVSKDEARAVSNLHFVRGDVLARLGRFEEAEQQLRREIELFPDSPQAYKNLALLLVSQGRNAEGARLLFELEQHSPTPPAYRAIIDTLATLGDEQGVRFWKRRARRRYPEATEFGV